MFVFKGIIPHEGSFSGLPTERFSWEYPSLDLQLKDFHGLMLFVMMKWVIKVQDVRQQ
jgi:hypothetical protein